LGTSFIFELSSHFDRRGVIAAIAVLLAASRRSRCRCGSILTTSIRTRSFLPSSRRAVPAWYTIASAERLSSDEQCGQLSVAFHAASSEVSNGRPTLAYFNPVVRIVAMDGSVERLEKIAADIHAAAPDLTVRLIDQAPHSNRGSGFDACRRNDQGKVA